MSKTTKTNTTANNAKTNMVIDEKLYTMNEMIDVLHKNGVSIASTKNNSTFYRILRGDTSIHIKKRGYIAYMTDDDLKLFDGKKIDGIDIEIGTNSTDKKRPNIARIDVKSFTEFVKVIAQNINNQFA